MKKGRKTKTSFYHASGASRAMIRGRGQPQFIICLPPFCQPRLSSAARFTGLRSGEWLIKQRVSIIQLFASESTKLVRMFKYVDKKEKKVFLRTLILSATLHFILATKTWSWGQTESSQISFRDEENKHCQLHTALLMDSSRTQWKISTRGWWNQRRWNLQQTGKMTFISF